MLKTYRIFREKIARPVTVRDKNGDTFSPKFISANGYMEFSTRDKAIQDLLEVDARFKSTYFLVYQEESENKEIKVIKDLKTNSENEKNSPPEGELEGAVEGTIFTDITTTQAAKALLRAKGIEIANAASKETVIEVAKANGIEFPNLT